MYVSIKPIKRLLSKEYFICRMNNIEKQIEYFNFPKLFKEGYILLHYTSLGRFYFYHPGKREFKNIAFIPEKELYFSDICFYFKGNCMSEIKFYMDKDSNLLTYVRETKHVFKVKEENNASTINIFYLKEIPLYLINNLDNQITKKETIKSKYHTGYIKYDDEYYTFIYPELKGRKHILIKQNRNNEIEEVAPLTLNSFFSLQTQQYGETLFQYDDAHIYLCSYIDNGNSDIRYAFDRILCDINLEEKTVTQCNRNRIIYNNIEFIWNQEMKETIMYNKDGKYIFEGPINDDIDRIRWTFIPYNWTPQIFPWEINISFDKKYIAITKSIKDIEDKANQIKSKDLCKLVRVEKYLYNLETKECEIVSFDTLVDTRVEMSNSQLHEEEEYLRYEGFETIRGKVVNGKFVKIKKGK